MPGQTRDKIRTLPVGAEVNGDGTEFRVWAPEHERVDVIAGSRSFPLEKEGNGYHSGLIPELRAGDTYQYRLGGDKQLLPDPASRFQPNGPHGPSQIVDPASFRWTDQNWRGVPMERAVVYELHIGTFTPEGTWRSAAQRLPQLRDVGVTVIEVMPVADFGGSYGWGYDGVNLFAPTRLYGTPDDMRSFVDKAHAHGIAVILDVVYNHLGADGNYLGQFAREYFSTKYTTDWGDALNFDGPNSGPVASTSLQTPPAGFANSTLMDCGSMPPRTFTMSHRRTFLPKSLARSVKPHPIAPLCSLPRMSRNTQSWFAAPPAVVMGWTDSGTTTFTIVHSWR